MKNLKEIFLKMDADGDGVISKDDIRNGFDQVGIVGFTIEDILDLVDALDVDQS